MAFGEIDWGRTTYPMSRARRARFKDKGLRSLGVPRLGTGRGQKQGLHEKVMWPPMALRIGLLSRSALQNDGRIKPVILQCRTPQETHPKGHWGTITFS